MSNVTRRRMTGVVTSDKMTKTVVVEISRTYKHPLYKKVVHATKRFKAHDELGAKVGDLVQLIESRPISREKSWVVEKIVRRQGEPAATAAKAAAEVETAPIDLAAATEIEAAPSEPTTGEGE